MTNILYANVIENTMRTMIQNVRLNKIPPGC